LPLIRAELQRWRLPRPGPLIHDLSQVLYLPFDHDDGSYARDRSGYNSHGIIYGATLATGKIGMARSLDGVDDYVDCGQPATLIGPKDAITLTVWIKPATTQVSSSHIVGIDGSYAIYMSNARAVSFWSWNVDGTWVRTTGYVIDGDKWSYLTATYDKDAGINNQKLYVNGVLAAQTTQTKPLRYFNRNFRVGRYGNFNLYTKGIVDEIRVYTRALSQYELPMLMYRRLV